MKAQFSKKLPNGWWRNFDVDNCEDCGDTVLAPNATQTDVPVGKFIYTDELPGEGSVRNDDGLFVCDACYREA